MRNPFSFMLEDRLLHDNGSLTELKNSLRSRIDNLSNVRESIDPENDPSVLLEKSITNCHLAIFENGDDGFLYVARDYFLEAESKIRTLDSRMYRFRWTGWFGNTYYSDFKERYALIRGEFETQRTELLSIVRTLNSYSRKPLTLSSGAKLFEALAGTGWEDDDVEKMKQLEHKTRVGGKVLDGDFFTKSGIILRLDYVNKMLEEDSNKNIGTKIDSLLLDTKQPAINAIPNVRMRMLKTGLALGMLGLIYIFGPAIYKTTAELFKAAEPTRTPGPTTEPIPSPGVSNTPFIPKYVQGFEYIVMDLICPAGRRDAERCKSATDKESTTAHTPNGFEYPKYTIELKENVALEGSRLTINWLGPIPDTYRLIATDRRGNIIFRTEVDRKSYENKSWSRTSGDGHTLDTIILDKFLPGYARNPYTIQIQPQQPNSYNLAEIKIIHEVKVLEPASGNSGKIPITVQCTDHGLKGEIAELYRCSNATDGDIVNSSTVIRDKDAKLTIFLNTQPYGNGFAYIPTKVDDLVLRVHFGYDGYDAANINIEGYDENGIYYSMTRAITPETVGMANRDPVFMHENKGNPSENFIDNIRLIDIFPELRGMKADIVNLEPTRPNQKINENNDLYTDEDPNFVFYEVEILQEQKVSMDDLNSGTLAGKGFHLDLGFYLATSPLLLAWHGARKNHADHSAKSGLTQTMRALEKDLSGLAGIPVRFGIGTKKFAAYLMGNMNVNHQSQIPIEPYTLQNRS